MTDATYIYAPKYDEALAVVEAVKDALKDLPWAQGKVIKAVVDEYAPAEQNRAYPSVVIRNITDGQYENTCPRPLEQTRIPTTGKGHVLFRDAEYVAQVELEVHATDKVMRSLVLRALRERIMSGTLDGTYERGFPCPDYYGGVSDVMVSLRGVSHEDDGPEVQGRRRMAVMRLQARLPVLRVEGITDLLPRFELIVDVAE